MLGVQRSVLLMLERPLVQVACLQGKQTFFFLDFDLDNYQRIRRRRDLVAQVAPGVGSNGQMRFNASISRIKEGVFASRRSPQSRSAACTRQMPVCGAMNHSNGRRPESG